MSYQVKRIDPYWIHHPGLPVAVVAGLIIAAFGARTNNVMVLGVGAVLAAAAVLAATKVVVSVVLAIMGVFGGIVTFVVFPKADTAGMAPLQQVLATIFFAVLYTILMDGLILAVSVLYNFFSEALGMGGVRLDIEEIDDDGAAA